MLKRQNEARLKQIDQQLTAIDAAIMELIEADPALSDHFAILVSIPGIAAITAVMRKLVVLANALLKKRQPVAAKTSLIITDTCLFRRPVLPNWHTTS